MTFPWESETKNKTFSKQIGIINASTFYHELRIIVGQALAVKRFPIVSTEEKSTN